MPNHNTNHHTARLSTVPPFLGPALLTLITLAVATAVVYLTLDDPTTRIINNWHITPIAFFAAAFANATAVGGGFLFVPLFTIAYQLPPLIALKLSLATQSFGMTSGALGWSRANIDLPSLVVSSTFGIAAMYVGTHHITIHPATIKPLFGVISVLLAVAIIIETRLGRTTNNTHATLTPRSIATLAVVCFAAGLLTAWTSIAIGEALALYLLFAHRVRIQTAIATGVAALAACSIAGLILHAQAGGIRFDLLAFTAPGAFLGGRYGARFGNWLESRGTQSDTETKASHKTSPLKWLFAGVILIDGIVMLILSF